MYEANISEIVAEYGGADIITFLLYAEIGHRDMIILKAGIEDVYDDEYFIDAQEINEETARAYEVYRGWKLSFIFVKDIKELEMAKWISSGLEQCKIKYDLIEVREVISNV